MSKNTIKKIILTIIILSVLILSLIFFFKITSEDYKDDVSVVTRIIKEKYEDIEYFDNSNYLYTYNKNNYTVYDYNGNLLYEFNKGKKLDITYVSKKYYIEKDNNYHLYDNTSEEIISGNNIYGINDYLIFVDNKIINPKGEILFDNVKDIKSYYKNKYFLVDNCFINEKGKVLLYDYKIVKEQVNDNELDYFIVKKGKKYYSFFPIVNKIIGDEFDKYFEYNNETYIVSNNKVYLIYKNGLRKEISFVINKNIYSVNYLNVIKKNRILTIRDYYLGLLETDTNKFHKIVKTKEFSFKFVDDSHINISCNNQNYLYNIDNYKIVYKNNFDDIVVFKNNYKTIKKNGKYYLLDDKDRKITSSDKQIILLDSKVKIGKVNEDIVLFDKEIYNGKKIVINDKYYYEYEVKKVKYIVSSDLKEKYESNLYLNHMNDTIVRKEKNTLYFYNKKNNKIYSYYLKDYRIKNKDINKNEIILSNNENIIVLNRKGKTIKKINNVLLEGIYYNKTKQSIILIVKKHNYRGAYILK